MRPTPRRFRLDTLKLAGDGASDTLRLDLSGPRNVLVVDVGADGTIDFTFDKTTFTAVSLTAGGGDDEVEPRQRRRQRQDRSPSTAAPATTRSRGGAGVRDADRRRGNDFVDGNQGADVALLRRRQRPLQLGSGRRQRHRRRRGPAPTRCDFNGANIGELFDVSANGGRVRFTRNIAAIVMDLDDIEQLDAARARRRRHASPSTTSPAPTCARSTSTSAGLDGTGDAAGRHRHRSAAPTAGRRHVGAPRAPAASSSPASARARPRRPAARPTATS